MSALKISVFVATALAGCALDPESELDTDTVESASSITQWIGGTWIPSQKSEWQVGLAYFNGRLYMVHNGHSDPHELWWSAFNGSSWTTNIKLSLRSTGGPSLIVRNNQLEMVYRDASQNRLLISTFTGSTFGAPRSAGSPLAGKSLKSEPATGLSGFGTHLLVAYCTNTSIRVDEYDGSQWRLLRELPAPDYASCEHVELAAVTGYGSTQLFYTTRNEMISWVDYPIYQTQPDDYYDKPRVLANKKTKQPISVKTCAGKTHMTHGGFSDSSEIWWSEKPTGSYTWGPDAKFLNQRSWGGAALGCMGDLVDGSGPQRMFLIHNNTDGRLYQLEFAGT